MVPRPEEDRKMNDLTRKPPVSHTVRRSMVANLLGDMHDAWVTHGKGAFDTFAREEPRKFIEACLRIIPKDIAIHIEQQHFGLDPADYGILREILLAIKQGVPDHGDRPPGEVLAFVLEAVRGSPMI
jgi:hypothetical protein